MSAPPPVAPPPFPQINKNLSLDNMRRGNLKLCDAFFWGFDAQQPPAYKAGLAVRRTIDFSIGTGKSRDWHEIANSLGFEIWNGQFYGLGNKRKAIFDVKLLDWLVPQNPYRDRGCLLPSLWREMTSSFLNKKSIVKEVENQNTVKIP